MSKALSVDLRDRVIAAVEDGMSCRQAATRFGVSASSAIRWRSRMAEPVTATPHHFLRCCMGREATASHPRRGSPAN